MIEIGILPTTPDEIMTLKEQVAKKNRVISSLKSKKDKATRAIYYWKTRDELVEFDKWQNIINKNTIKHI